MIFLRSLGLLLLSIISQFSVAQSSSYFLDVRKEDRKVLYAGYDNMISVPKNASLKASGGALSKYNDTSYIMKIPGNLIGKTIELVAKSGAKEWKRSILVKAMPQPSLLLGKIAINGNVSMQKASLMNLIAQPLALGYPAETQIPFRRDLTSFSVEVRVNGASRLKEGVNGSKIPSAVATLIKSLPAFELIITDAKTTEQFGRIPDGKISVK